jgi:hypothetical protein
MPPAPASLRQCSCLFLPQLNRLLPYLVLVNSVIAAPIVNKHNRITVHARRMTTTPANVIDRIPVRLLWDKPNAGFAAHTFTAAFPWIINHF